MRVTNLLSKRNLPCGIVPWEFPQRSVKSSLLSDHRSFTPPVRIASSRSVLPSARERLVSISRCLPHLRASTVVMTHLSHEGGSFLRRLAVTKEFGYFVDSRRLKRVLTDSRPFLVVYTCYDGLYSILSQSCVPLAHSWPIHGSD